VILRLMAKPYEDIGKDGSELISKGFPNSGNFKLTSETNTPNGVTVTSTASRIFETKDDKREEKISGTVEPKFEWAEHNAEITSKLSTVGEFELGTSVKDLGTKGTKFGFTGIQSDKDGIALKVNGAFKNDNVSIKAGVKYPFKVKSHVNYNGELTFRYPDYLYWGADVRYNSAIPGPSTLSVSEQPVDQHFWNAKVGFISEDHQINIALEQSENKDKKTQKANPVLQTLNLGFFQTINESLKLAFGFTAERANVKGIEFATAGEYKVDKSTSLKSKFSVVGAKDEADKEFRLGLAVKQLVAEHATVTVGADINARALLGGPQAEVGSSKPHSFGFEIKFQ